MGRSRRRQAARTAPAVTPTVAPAVLRRTLGAYLAAALLLAVLVLVATVALAPMWAPWVVLVADAAASLALYRWAYGRMADLPLSDEDRVMQTLATGLLVMVLLFAAIAAVVLTAT